MLTGQFSEAAATGIPLLGGKIKRVDPDERLVLVTPETPGFEEIRDILFAEEPVYPGDDNFDGRFGNGSIDRLGAPGTDNKLALALMTPTRIRVAGYVFLSAQPETNGKIHLGNAPCYATAIREASPEVLQTQANYITAYAFGNLSKSKKPVQPPDDQALAEDATDRYRDAVQILLKHRFALVTASPNPKYPLWEQEHPQYADLPDLTRAIKQAFDNMEAQVHGDKQRRDLGQTYHMGRNGAYIGRFLITNGVLNTSYAYDARRPQMEENRDLYAQGFLPVAKYIRDRLDPEDRKRTVERPSEARIVQQPGAHFTVNGTAFTASEETLSL